MFNLFNSLGRDISYNKEESTAQYQRRALQEELPALRSKAERYYLEHYADTRALDPIFNIAQERIYKAKSVAGIDTAINKARRQIIKDYTGQMGGII